MDSDNATYVSTEPAYVSFNITKQGIAAAYSTMATAATNSTGYANFSFLPDQTFEVSKQNWRAFTSSSDSCYQFNQTGTFNVTTLTNAPKLENYSVNITSDGWGINRKFNITVFDQNDTVNVSLWRATGVSGPWQFVASQNTTAPNAWEVLNYTVNYTCSDIGTWYYKFNATNTVENTNTTLASADRNITLTKDSVIFEDLTSPDIVSNRSGIQTTPLKFQSVTATAHILPASP